MKKHIIRALLCFTLVANAVKGAQGAASIAALEPHHIEEVIEHFRAATEAKKCVCFENEDELLSLIERLDDDDLKRKFSVASLLSRQERLLKVLEKNSKLLQSAQPGPLYETLRNQQEKLVKEGMKPHTICSFKENIAKLTRLLMKQNMHVYGVLKSQAEEHLVLSETEAAINSIECHLIQNSYLKDGESFAALLKLLQEQFEAS